MANKKPNKTAKSSQKRTIRNAAAAKVNSDRRNATRTAVKKVEKAVLSGDVAAAKEALKAARPSLQRTAAKGVMNKKTVSRKISRLSARVKALDTKA